MDKKSVVSIALIALLLGAFGVSLIPRDNFGAAPAGLQSRVASSTLETVNTTATTIVATTTNCASRIITTTGKGIMLTFSDRTGQSPTATYGHWQGASTTVAYDSGLYGCDLIKAISQDAASIITASVTY